KFLVRKLLSEEWLLSKGKYQRRGESTAKSFSHMTSKPACLRVSRHLLVDLISGRPSPISISAASGAWQVA
ncbi:hypothetical protein PanWU01x14_050790, partial [Parasponia andersonii]